MKHLFDHLGPFYLGCLTAALGLFLDQAWKITFLYGAGWLETLGPGPNGIRHQVLPFFDIVMVWNYGISYGLFQATTEFGRWALAVTALTVTGGLIWWLRSVKDLQLAIAIGLIVGGALGNVIDRILYGAVADFFLLHAFGYNWYVFNLADVAVVGGVLLLALDLLTSEYRKRSGVKGG